MEATFDPQGCDEVVEKPSLWTNEKLKDLWVSLLNLEAVSKACEDVELQGILLLLETIFSIFKNIKKKYDATECSYKAVKHDLDGTKEELQRVKVELKRCKNSSCERCLELEKELMIQKKKQETNENRIKSIVKILSMNNGSEDPKSNSEVDQHPVVAKAYNLVSQMLLGEETKLYTKRERHNSTGSDKMRTPGKKKKKLNTPDVLVLNEPKKETELVNEETSSTSNERKLFKRDESVPETLDCSQRIVPICIMKDNKIGIELTPKKKDSQMSEANSPILGGSGKKPSCLSNYINSSPQEDSSDECTLKYESMKDPTKSLSESQSPSLLKSQPITTNIIIPENDNLQECNTTNNNSKMESNTPVSTRNNKENIKKVQADFWKLHPTSGIECGNRKLKQTTLSLARHPKKNDLSSLKEFNGGVRQSVNEDDSLAGKINGNCDEDASLQLAIQESLKGKENVEYEAKTGNLGIEYAEDDDDFIFKSPRVNQKKSNHRLVNLFNKKSNFTSSRSSPSKKRSDTLQNKETDETFFVPLFTSTMKEEHSTRGNIKRIPESPDTSSENFLLELGSPAEGPEQVPKHENSFDRIPGKVPTSPNYKYRRNTVRKKIDRQKLDGWECEQCKNYYALGGEDLNSTEMKQRLKVCSRHRDKYPVISTSPPGYWDIKLIDTDMTRVDDRRK